MSAEFVNNSPLPVGTLDLCHGQLVVCNTKLIIFRIIHHLEVCGGISSGEVAVSCAAAAATTTYYHHHHHFLTECF
jgi:hypothetical protein